MKPRRRRHLAERRRANFDTPSPRPTKWPSLAAMSSTVADLFRAAHVEPAPGSPVRWNTTVPEDGPGVYVIALADDVDSFAERLSVAPISGNRVADLLRVRPELRLDGVRPTQAELEERLTELWLSDEAILYVGLATSLRHRVGAYYRTALGARRPHAGGWPLKTLSILDDLFVHYAPCAGPPKAEHAMLGAFRDQASEKAAGAALFDGRPLPFANLEWATGQAKQHGITGAREPRRPRSARPDAAADPGPVS